MVANTVRGTESVEAIKSRGTGILFAFSEKTREWCIYGDNDNISHGKFAFTADMCPSTDGDNGEAVFNSLHKGDRVSFVPGEDDRAKEIVVVSQISSEEVAHQVKEEFRIAMEQMSRPIEAMGPPMSGTIKTMQRTGETGFGFITPTDGNKSVFFESSTCTGGWSTFNDIFEKYEDGAEIKVTFNVQDSPKGPGALNVAIDTSVS